MDAITGYFAIALIVFIAINYLIVVHFTRLLERVIKLLESIECDVESMSKDSWQDHHNL